MKITMEVKKLPDNFTGIVEYPNGTKFWYKNGFRHRDDGPAIEDIDGTKLWYKNNLKHREDGPAIEGSDGYKSWWLNGKLHRDEGPAVVYTDGTKAWYINGINYSETEYYKEMEKKNQSNICKGNNGKIVEIDGKKYKLIEIS